MGRVWLASLLDEYLATLRRLVINIPLGFMWQLQSEWYCTHSWSTHRKSTRVLNTILGHIKYMLAMILGSGMVHIYQLCNMNLIMDFKIKFIEYVNTRYVNCLYTAGILRTAQLMCAIPDPSSLCEGAGPPD